MKSRTKRNPTSSPAKTIDAGLQVEPRKGSGPSLPVVPLPVPLAQGVAELVRLTGLEEPAVVRHLLSSGLLWCGLTGFGRESFKFLAETTMGKEGAKDFLEQATETACAIEVEGSSRVAYQRQCEAAAAFPGDWPAEA